MVDFFNQEAMDKSAYKSYKIFNGFKCVVKWIWHWIYIILVAFMLSISNVYYDERRMINDVRNFVKQEQVFNDEDEIENENNAT